MKKIHFSVLIDAPRETVWKTVTDPATYRQWTAPFAPGSRFEGSWEQGARIMFTADGTQDGMLSTIEQSRRPEFISIRHLGMLTNGVEDLANEWSGAHENYTLREVEGGTEFSVDQDITDDHAQMMSETWPKALAELKRLCEAS